MTRRGSLRTRHHAAAAVLAAVALVFGVGTGPAWAALPAQYWFRTLTLTQAWTISKGAGVTVAVVGAGVVPTIGDLRGQVLAGVDLVAGGGDGHSDPGEDCSGAGGCYSAGTDAAVRIAGTGAGAGYQGIAPQARILPVKITERSGQSATPAQVAQGIRWAVDHGAQIIQVPPISEGDLCPAVEDEAGSYAYNHGVLVVAGIGDHGRGSEQAPSGCYGTLAVTASDANFTAWSRTNFGPNAAFTAPGVNVPAETVSGQIRPRTDGSGGAAAIVAGEFALLRAHFPHAGERELITRALYNVHNGLGKFGIQIDYKLGYGEILPFHAMHDALPAHTVNPIYDDWHKALGDPAVTGAPTAAPPTGTPDSPDSSTGPSTGSTASGPPNGGVTVAGKSGGSGTSGALIVGIVVVVVLVLGGGAVLLVRTRRGRRAGAP